MSRSQASCGQAEHAQLVSSGRAQSMLGWLQLRNSHPPTPHPTSPSPLAPGSPLPASHLQLRALAHRLGRLLLLVQLQVVELPAWAGTRKGRHSGRRNSGARGWAALARAVGLAAPPTPGTDASATHQRQARQQPPPPSPTPPPPTSPHLCGSVAVLYSSMKSLNSSFSSLRGIASRSMFFTCGQVCGVGWGGVGWGVHFPCLKYKSLGGGADYLIVAQARGWGLAVGGWAATLPRGHTALRPAAPLRRSPCHAHSAVLYKICAKPCGSPVPQRDHPRGVGLCPGLEVAGQPVIAQLELARVGEEQVGELEVAVHHPAVVQVAHGRQQL